MDRTKVATEWVVRNEDRLTALSDLIWSYAEPAFLETKSASALEDEFRSQGFVVETGVTGIPTAFTASWGSQGPVIGFIGEYDAVPGTAYKISSIMEPNPMAKAGHACGHNLLGVGSLAACVATKVAIETLGLKGRVKYFGCPAEEGGAAKVFMVRDGVFNGVDAILRWHPANTNWVSMSNSLAINSVKFTFHGVAAHAGINPHLGRSALDAAILMDVGVNYLREHVVPEVRMHSSITNGGGAPNVVPPLAQIWYYVRAPKRTFVDEVYQRIVQIAQGAAMMTGTTVDSEFLNGCHETLPNRVLSEVMERCFQATGAPKFDESEKEFAAKLTAGISLRDKELSLRPFVIDESVARSDLHEEVAPTKDAGHIMPISSDSADVSWNVPTAQLFACCQPIGSANHSWQQSVCSGMGIGHEGMLSAARAIAATAVELLYEPTYIAKARAEFQAAIARTPYESPLPEGLKPALPR